jgi:hypothetical protein
MKLKFTRKTWYFFLLAAAAMSMLGGFAVLGGMDFSGLELIVFCITGGGSFCRMRLELLDAVGVSYAGAFPEGTELQPLEGM